MRYICCQLCKRVYPPHKPLPPPPPLAPLLEMLGQAYQVRFLPELSMIHIIAFTLWLCLKLLPSFNTALQNASSLVLTCTEFLAVRCQQCPSSSQSFEACLVHVFFVDQRTKLQAVLLIALLPAESGTPLAAKMCLNTALGHACQSRFLSPWQLSMYSSSNCMLKVKQ